MADATAAKKSNSNVYRSGSVRKCETCMLLRFQIKNISNNQKNHDRLTKQKLCRADEQKKNPCIQKSKQRQNALTRNKKNVKKRPTTRQNKESSQKPTLREKNSLTDTYSPTAEGAGRQLTAAAHVILAVGAKAHMVARPQQHRHTAVTAHDAKVPRPNLGVVRGAGSGWCGRDHRRVRRRDRLRLSRR